MQRALVIGASGQVGGALMEAIGAERAVGTYAHNPTGGFHAFDLATAAARPGEATQLFEAAEADIVFIAAGMTYVDGCEDDPELAYALNGHGPAALARAARERGARTVFFSTEYVFDGVAGPYGEDDPPRPLSVYGKSKLAGERAVQEADPEALIVRTTVVYGPESLGKNFAYQAAAALEAGRPMRVPSDQRSSPTYNRDLAAAVLSLVAARAHGLYHVAGPEVMDRLSFARRLARTLGQDETLFEGVATASLGQRAKRPLDAGLRIDKLLASPGGPRMRRVEEALEDWRRRPRGRPWPSGPSAAR